MNKLSIKYIISWMQQKHMLDFLSDKSYCSIVLYARTGHFANYKTPVGFNEKIQWLKIYNRKETLTKYVDKLAAKEIVRDIIGEDYLIPTIKVWENVDDMKVDDLPEQFVLKCNHDGGIIICRNKSMLDFEKTKNVLRQRLKTNYYNHAREWPYKNITPKVFAEPLVTDGDKQNLPVYKFFCFSGEPRLVQTIQDDKTANETIDYFDLEWNHLDIRQNYPNSNHPLECPDKLQEMIQIVKILCVGFPFVRIDLYQANEKILFSEFTLYSDAGFEPFYPEKWDKTLGDMIVLPAKSNR